MQEVLPERVVHTVYEVEFTVLGDSELIFTTGCYATFLEGKGRRIVGNVEGIYLAAISALSVIWIRPISTCWSDIILERFM